MNTKGFKLNFWALLGVVVIGLYGCGGGPPIIIAADTISEVESTESTTAVLADGVIADGVIENAAGSEAVTNQSEESIAASADLNLSPSGQPDGASGSILKTPEKTPEGLSKISKKSQETYTDARKQQNLEELNQQIAIESLNSSARAADVLPSRDDYSVGPDDVLEIAVFQVEELNRKVRVTGDGFIMIPLLGGVKVEGLTTTQIEQRLVEGLSRDYLHDPQVSVFVDEFKSHQVAVLGAVNDPNIYNIRQPRTILEMLAKAGGLHADAGTQVQVRRTVLDPVTQEGKREALIMDLGALLENAGQLEDIALYGGDSVVVPKAGSVFVEGAVLNPGAYGLQSETNVLKALSMAGGITYETSKQKIEVYREVQGGDSQVFELDYDAIRQNPGADLLLEEGDIIVVHHSSLKRGLSNFWKGISGIFRVGL